MDLKGKEITPEERKIIIKLRNEGKTLREIGKIVGRTHSSIKRVINNYTSSKSIISKPRSRRPSKLTAREKRYVFKSVIQEGPTEWPCLEFGIANCNINPNFMDYTSEIHTSNAEFLPA
ncbi:uncharacterized protein CDAR_226811 [Caerostris darwini]|uniref:Transposase IS30-like HTH domain-containing protein n=1 Tax=Caerostris darwini TaxID=1538125 RepID=A0AAV4UUT9_9ARAC|nr:uncharacterized protein CDAR_226811 [Caerostris darwini]